MKKLLLFAVALLFAAPAFAQLTDCMPANNLDGTPGTELDDEFGVVYLNPGNGVLPDMDDTYYEETFFFKFKNGASISGFTADIESVTITDLTWGVDPDNGLGGDGLPAGLSFRAVSGFAADNTADSGSIVPPANLIFQNPDISNENEGGPYGCVKIYGTNAQPLDPATLNNDTLNINVTLQITVDNPLVPSSLTTATEAFKIPYKGTLGLHEDLAASLNMRLAPNPASQDVNMMFTTLNTQEMTFGVYDLQGRQMNVTTNGTFQPGDHNVSLDVSNLSTGMYMVKSVVAGQVYTTKFLKN